MVLLSSSECSFHPLFAHFVCLPLAERTLPGSHTSDQPLNVCLMSFLVSFYPLSDLEFFPILEEMAFGRFHFPSVSFSLMQTQLSLADLLAHHLTKPMSYITFFVSYLGCGITQLVFFLMQIFIWSFLPSFSVPQKQISLFIPGLSTFLCLNTSAQSHNEVFS